MKKTHKINCIVLWAGTTMITLSNLIMIGVNDITMKSIIATVLTSIVATILYFTPINDVIKGTLIVLCYTHATLITSILQGGNEITFLLSIIGLGLALIYFNSKIIAYSTFIYMISCVIAYIVNPAYIGGIDADQINVILEIAVYITIGTLMYIGTRNGEKLLKKLEDNSAILTKQSDELEASAVTYKQISTKLHKSILNSTHNVSEVNDTISNLYDAASQMEKSIEETSNSVINLNQKVISSEENINADYKYSDELKNRFIDIIERTTASNEKGSNVNESMNKVYEVMNEAKESTTALFEQTKKISIILGEINSIAEETDLLSLNASIEAARAGEHGRGFAVVADEIRNLSSQTQKSALSIENILNGFGNTIKDVSERVLYGAKIIEDNNNELIELIEYLKEVDEDATHAQRIVNKEYDLIKGIEDDFTCIKDEIQTIVAISQENTAMINGVSNIIGKQKDSIQTISDELTDISQVSKELV